MSQPRRSAFARRAKFTGFAAACLIGWPLAARAAVIGPGLVSISGADTGDRLNIDDTFTQTLGPGNYSVDNFTYNSTGAGNVVPFLATGTGVANEYQLLWLGGAVTGAASGT